MHALSLRILITGESEQEKKYKKKKKRRPQHDYLFNLFIRLLLFCFV